MADSASLIWLYTDSMLHNMKCTSDQQNGNENKTMYLMKIMAIFNIHCVILVENNNDNLVMPLSQLSQREKFYIDALMRS
ncbi:unnamed protein product [Rhizophagus irregularis]|nr:unnamed protein product [Rhizophagus irregularis]CAB4446182.1 unnamed protein product [Rhizophagus irregularis]